MVSTFGMMSKSTDARTPRSACSRAARPRRTRCWCRCAVPGARAKTPAIGPTAETQSGPPAAQVARLAVLALRNGQVVEVHIVIDVELLPVARPPGRAAGSPSLVLRRISWLWCVLCTWSCQLPTGGTVAGRRLRRAEVLRVEVAGARADAGVVRAAPSCACSWSSPAGPRCAGHVAAAVDHVQDAADLAVDGQRRAFVAILVERRREGSDLVLLQGPAVGARRIGIEVSVRMHVLVVLLQQHVPAVVDPPQRGDAQALDSRPGWCWCPCTGPLFAVGLPPRSCGIVPGNVADGCRDVVDVAATAVGEDHRAQTRTCRRPSAR